MNPDIKVLFPIWTVSFLTQKSCMSVFGVRRLFLRLSYGNAPRTQYSLNGSPVCNCKIKGLFWRGF